MSLFKRTFVHEHVVKFDVWIFTQITDNERVRFWFKGDDIIKFFGIPNVHTMRTTGHSTWQMIQGSMQNEQSNDVPSSPWSTDTLFISEGCLYGMFATIQRDDAQAFETWIVNDIIPTLRQLSLLSHTKRELADVKLQLAELQLEYTKTRIQYLDLEMSYIKRDTEQSAQKTELLKQNSALLRENTALLRKNTALNRRNAELSNQNNDMNEYVQLAHTIVDRYNEELENSLENVTSPVLLVSTRTIV